MSRGCPRSPLRSVPPRSLTPSCPRRVPEPGAPSPGPLGYSTQGEVLPFDITFSHLMYLALHLDLERHSNVLKSPPEHNPAATMCARTTAQTWSPLTASAEHPRLPGGDTWVEAHCCLQR